MVLQDNPSSDISKYRTKAVFPPEDAPDIQ